MQSFYPLPQSEWFLPSGIAVPSEQDLRLYRLEELRQWILRELIDTYQYPPFWLQKRMVFDYKVYVGNQERVIDLVLLNAIGEPFVFILLTDKEQIETIGGINDQARSYMSMFPSVLWSIATNGERLTLLYKQKRNQIVKRTAFESYSFPSSTPVTRKDLGERYGLNDQDVLEHLAQLVNFLNEVGLKEQDVITTLLQILIVKFFDEYRREEEPVVFQPSSFGNADEFFSTLQAYYQQILRQISGDQRKQPLSQGWTDKSLFPSTIIDLPTKEFFRVWREHVNPLVVSASLTAVSSQVLSSLFEPLLKNQVLRADKLEYLTRFLLSLHGETTSYSVLDLCSADGQILESILREFVKREQHTLFSDFSLFYTLQGVEKNQVLAQLSFFRLLLNGYKQPHIYHGAVSAYCQSQHQLFSFVLALDFKQKALKNLAAEYDLFTASYSRLTSDGRICLAVSNDFLSHPDYVAARKAFLDECRVYAIIGLPRDIAEHPSTMIIAKKAEPHSEIPSGQEVLVMSIDRSEDFSEVSSQFFTKFPQW
ncbi:MAG: type I restriction enzyme HsdR N-terminal domain-containing protein [bacterium]